MTNPKELIYDNLKNFLERKVIEVDFEVSLVSNPIHGDFSSNIALVANKETLKQVQDDGHKNPREFAEEIVKFLNESDEVRDTFEKIEIAGPGFINFYLSKKSLEENLNAILQKKEEFGKKNIRIDQLEMYENTQPNTNKPLHIGHLRNTALGVSITNLRKATSINALSVNINNDRGIHICKSMLGFLYQGLPSVNKIRNSVSAEEWQKSVVHYNVFNKYPLYWKETLKYWFEHGDWWLSPAKVGTKPDKFVGQYYIDSSQEEERDTRYKEYLGEMLQAWENGDEKVRKLWEQMNSWFYEGFKETHARFLGIKPEDPQFDKEWYESDIYDAGKKIAEENVGKGIFYKREDGAIMADLKKYNLPDKVVVRPDGTTVYITQDLELARQRVEEEKARFIGYVVGSEQELHFQQLFAICDALGFGKKENYKHISYGMVNLKGGIKMSSREGNIVSADDLMDSIKAKIGSKFEMEEAILEKVMIGAIKYWMLKFDPKSEINFDMEESVNVNGNSGPYLQYTYVRTRSVMEKMLESSQLSVHSSQLVPSDQLKNENSLKIENWKLEIEETELLRFLVQFPYVLESAADGFAPNLLCNYLFELSQKFNLFYQKHKIIGSEKEAFRLHLTKAVGQVLQNGLSILGIETVERM